MRLSSLLAACGLLLALPGSALALPDVVPLPKHAHAGVHLSVAEGKDGELVVKLGLEDKQLRFPVGGVSVAVYEKGPVGSARSPPGSSSRGRPSRWSERSSDSPSPRAPPTASRVTD